MAFVIEAEGNRLGIITDLGTYHAELVKSCQDLDVLYLESNHDLEMLWEGPYPHRLKKRVASDYGHLNNQQAGALLKQLVSQRLQIVMLAHLSEQNNTPELAFHEARKAIADFPEIQLAVAPQHEPSVWVNVCSKVATPEAPHPRKGAEEETPEPGNEDLSEMPLAVRHQVSLFTV